MFPLTIFLILFNILKISLQSPQDEKRCSEIGCFPDFWEKIFGPEMRKLKKSPFLDFKKETLKDLEEFGDKKCSCGKYFLKEMQKIEYGDWHFRVSPKEIGWGTTSNIYHAHAMTTDLKDFDGKPLKLEKCVAIKARTLVKIGNDNYFFLMEMGEHNLRKFLEKIWQTNKEKIEIVEIFKNKFIEILEAVKEMHKSVIHLDLKPENLLFVKEADGKGGHKMTLKIIDFGGSEFISKNSEINVEKRANVCKYRPNMIFTWFYASPEQRKCKAFKKANETVDYYEFSTKSDMWAVGVILLELEMITYAPIFKNGIGQVRVNDAINFIKGMFKLGGDLIDIQKLGPTLRKIIVTLHDEFSKLFSNMLKATVNKVPTMRTTARGLLDFLAGICHLKMPLEEKIKFKSNLYQYIERGEYVEVTIFGQNNPQELPECDQQTTGNPSALSDEVKSNEAEIMEEKETIYGRHANMVVT